MKGFLYQYKYSLRAITNKHHTPANIPTDITDINAKIKSFQDYLTQQAAAHRFTCIVNMDQTPVWLDIATIAKTINQVGARKASTLIT